MINPDMQSSHLEAGMLIAECVHAATKLGFTIAVQGNFSVHQWTGNPLTQDCIGDSLFESDYITNVIDWLAGVSYGRSNVK